MTSEENINNSYSYNAMPDDKDEKVSRYQIDRRRKQAQLKRQVRKSKHNVQLLLVFSRLFLLVALVLIGYFTLKLKYWRLNPHAFDSLGNTSIKIENNYITPSQRILKAIQENDVYKGPIFLMNTDEIKESILKIPPIQNVYIKRFYYSQINICF